MKKSVTSNKRDSISIVHRTIAYVVLTSQILTSCGSPRVVPAPRDAEAGGLEMAEMGLNHSPADEYADWATGPAQNEETQQFVEPQEPTHRICPPSIACVRETAQAVADGTKRTYSKVKRVYGFVEETVNAMSKHTPPATAASAGNPANTPSESRTNTAASSSSGMGERRGSNQLATYREEANEDEDGQGADADREGQEEAEEEGSNPADPEEDTEATIIERIKRQTLWGARLVAAASLTFTLYRAQSSGAAITVTTANGKKTASNGWITYTYPQSYHRLETQAEAYMAKFKDLRQAVDRVVSMSPCSAYENWKFLPNAKTHQEAKSRLYAHKEACQANGRANLEPEFSENLQAIYRVNSYKNGIYNESGLWDNESDDIGNLHDDTEGAEVSDIAFYDNAMPNATSGITLPWHVTDTNPKIFWEWGSGNKSHFSSIRESIDRRLGYSNFDQSNFDANYKDLMHGVHLYCYLYPYKGSKSQICSTDSGGYWVVPSEYRNDDEYFDNLDYFLSSAVAGRRVKKLDCLGKVKDEEYISHIDPKFGIIKGELALSIKKCIRGAFAPLRYMRVSGYKDWPWRYEARGELAYPITDCVKFKAYGQLNFNALYRKTYRYVYSYITGIGPKVGEMNSECSEMEIDSYNSYRCTNDNYVRDRWIELKPESTKECEDYKARLAELEAELQKAKNELNVEKEAVKDGLKTYQEKYKELEAKQNELVDKYKAKAESIASILKDLEAIKTLVNDLQKDTIKEKARIEAEIERKKRELEEEARRTREAAERLAFNTKLKAKLADCEVISLELQSLQTNYSQFVDKAFDDIQEGLQNIMQENEAVLKDIQSQPKVGTLGSEMKGMKEARERDITRQQELKEQYIANEAQNLQLLLTANTTSADRDQQLVALQESNKQIFEELSTLNEAISARQEQIENYREITQNTTQQIGVESDKLKNRLVAVGEELVKVNEAIETRKEESKEKQKALSEKGDANTQCINEAQEMQKTNVDNTNEDLKKSLQRSNTLREELAKLNEELAKLNTEKEANSARETKESIEKKRQEMLDEIQKLLDLAQQTATDVNQGLDDAKDLDGELWQWNHNFTATMTEHNNKKLYKTLKWYVDKKTGLEAQMCPLVANPVTDDEIAAKMCALNVYADNYFGTLDNSYMQIPASVRWLYFNFRPDPKTETVFDVINRTYDMQLEYHQRVYKEQNRASQAYTLNLANLGRAIYGEPVYTQLVNQTKASIAQLDANVMSYMQAKQDSFDTFSNAIPRVLSATICLFILKALAYKSQSGTENPVKAADLLAYGSKMALPISVALLGYTLAAPVNDYATGSEQIRRNFLLIAEAACLAMSAFAVNCFTFHVHPTIEKIVAVLGGGLTVYHFFHLPEFTVTSEVPTCAANLPHERLALNNEQVNSFLAANVLPDRTARILDSVKDMVGSAYAQANDQVFTHCNSSFQENAEQAFRYDVRIFLLQFCAIVTLVSHVVTAVKGYSLKELTNLNYGLFLARCGLCVASNWPMQTIDFKLSMPQPGALELLLAALVMSMNVKSTTAALNQGDDQAVVDNV